jgi:hypothetical protein
MQITPRSDLASTSHGNARRAGSARSQASRCHCESRCGQRTSDAFQCAYIAILDLWFTGALGSKRVIQHVHRYRGARRRALICLTLISGALSQFSHFLLHLISHLPTFVPDLALSACFVYVCGELASSSLLFENKKSLSCFEYLHVYGHTRHDKTILSLNTFYKHILLSNTHSSLQHLRLHFYVKSESLFPSPNAISFHSTILLLEPLLPTRRPQPANRPFPSHARQDAIALPSPFNRIISNGFLQHLADPSGHCTLEGFNLENI